jgi:OOP family OmpA-OmpF porin
MSEGGKFEMAKNVASRMNHTIPDIELVAALRTLGEGRSNESGLVYGPTDYRRGDFEPAIMGVQGFGATPLGRAIEAAGEDLRAAQGDIAVIVLSDGKETDRRAFKAAEEMKEKFGDRLCIYTVLFGDDPAGRKLMEQIASLGECSYFVTADAIYSSGDMASLVEKAFLQPAPIGARLERDEDGDGVPDGLDQCPNTPQGATVNSVGCWAFQEVVLFDFDRYEIKPEAYPLLNEVVAILKRTPRTKVEIQGHTDNVGTAEYNQELSEKRAKQVRDYIVKNGIAPQRLSHRGYGLTRPLASNGTKEGRAKNRRVELRRH